MINIFLVEDHPIVRYGIKSLLELNPDYSIAGESDSAEALLLDIKKLKIDLVISDISLGGMDGIELTRQVKRISGGAIKVLILSMHADEAFINQCFEAGANGYMLKDFKNSELGSAIQRIMKGEKFISRSASQILADNYISKEFSGTNKSGSKIEVTKREREIMELISHGYSNKEIAEKIFVSTSTVDAHRYNILKKMEVKNTAEMITKAIKLKLIVLK